MLTEQGFLFLRFNNDQLLEIEDRMDIVDALHQLSKGVKRPLLVEAGERNDITREARKYNLEEKVNAVVLAEALVINSLSTRIAARFYFNMRNVPFKMRFFKEKEPAIEWLLAYQQPAV